MKANSVIDKKKISKESHSFIKEQFVCLFYFYFFDTIFFLSLPSSR